MNKTKRCLVSLAAAGNLLLVPGAIAEQPGLSKELFGSPPYKCTAHRFVSTSGSDANDGLTAGSPWLTLRRADAAMLAPGTCVNIAPGLYQTGTVVLRHGVVSASPAGYVVYRSTTLGGARIQARQGTPFDSLVAIHTSYLMFDGVEVDGNANTAFGACFESSTPSGSPGHHLWFLNLTVHGCGLSGIQLNNREYYYVLHNVVYGNSSSNGSGLFGSGISVYNPEQIASYVPTAMDNSWSPYRVVIAYNISRDNFNHQSGSSNTDGNGIILDDWRHTQNSPRVSYQGEGLVMGNLTYRNGSKGIHSFFSENVTIANNTSYNNNWDTHQTATWRAEISVQGGANVKVLNNIAWAIPGPGILRTNVPFLGQQAIGRNLWANNIAFGATNSMGRPDLFPTSVNRIDNPQFTNASKGDFALQPGSPAIGFGRPGMYFPPSPIDAGAYQYSKRGALPASSHD